MIFDKKILKKKIGEVTVREFLKLKDEKGNFYKDITEKCIFKPFCVGGSTCSIYGADDSYYDLGIYYKGDLLFKLDVNSFKEKTVWLIKSKFSEGEDIKFHWLDNGSFMIVKKVSWLGI